MRILLKLSILLSILFFTISCSREGTGGDATLVTFLAHHGVNIPNQPTYVDTVYVKFNAKESPGGITKYDTYFVGEAGEDHVHCENMKWGDYYLFGCGYDTLQQIRVTGGMHVKIKRSDRKNEIDVDLAVSE